MTIYPNQTLPELLQDLTPLVRRHIASGQPMNLDSLTGLHSRLRDAHRLSLAPDLITHAMSGQIGPRMGELIDLREALAREQRELQADLDAVDAGELAHPAAKGRAEATHAKGAVVILPVVNRSRHDDGDAA